MLSVIYASVIYASVIYASVIYASVIYAQCHLCWVSFILGVILLHVVAPHARRVRVKKEEDKILI